MKIRDYVWATFFLMICTYTIGFAYGQGSEAGSEGWNFSITPSLWIPSLDGDLTVKGSQTDINVDLDDAFEDGNLGMTIELEARKNRFGFFINPSYAQLEEDSHLLDINVDMAIIEFGGLYRLGTWSPGTDAGSSGSALTADAYAGGRYTYVDVDLDGILTPSGDWDWVDPIIGLRTLWNLSSKWMVTVAGDVGGFGASSDFTWQVNARIGYAPNDHLQIFGGYRAIGWDYEEGSGIGKFEWDVTLHGPMVGLVLMF